VGNRSEPNVRNQVNNSEESKNRRHKLKRVLGGGARMMLCKEKQNRKIHQEHSKKFFVSHLTPNKWGEKKIDSFRNAFRRKTGRTWD